MRAFRYTNDKGTDIVEEDIPAEMREVVEAAREELVAKAGETDHALMEKYIEGHTVEVDELKAAIRLACTRFEMIPVLCGSALKNKGVQRLMDAVCEYLPSPLDVPPIQAHVATRRGEEEGAVVEVKADPEEPFVGLMFKITADSHGDLHWVRVYRGRLETGTRILNTTRDKKENVQRIWRMNAEERIREDEVVAGDIVALVGLRDTVTGDTLCDTRTPILLEKITAPKTVISMAIEPKTSADRQRLGEVLQILTREDPTFKYAVNNETGETLISGMGELHLEVL